MDGEPVTLQLLEKLNNTHGVAFAPFLHARDPDNFAQFLCFILGKVRVHEIRINWNFSRRVGGYIFIVPMSEQICASHWNTDSGSVNPYNRQRA